MKGQGVCWGTVSFIMALKHPSDVAFIFVFVSSAKCKHVVIVPFTYSDTCWILKSSSKSLENRSTLFVIWHFQCLNPMSLTVSILKFTGSGYKIKTEPYCYFEKFSSGKLMFDQSAVSFFSILVNNIVIVLITLPAFCMTLYFLISLTDSGSWFSKYDRKLQTLLPGHWLTKILFVL